MINDANRVNKPTSSMRPPKVSMIAARIIKPARGGPAAGKMDLLTVVEHELGHELGLNDVDPGTHPGDLMASTLPTGTRRFIGS